MVRGWVDAWRRRQQFRRALPELYERTRRDLAVERRNVQALAQELALLRGGGERAFPGLTPAEIERLAVLAEECGEVVQIAMKVLRHGWESCSPFDLRSRTNRMLLEREMGDVRAAVGLMLDCRDVRLSEVQTWQRRKRKAMETWMHWNCRERVSEPASQQVGEVER